MKPSNKKYKGTPGKRGAFNAQAFLDSAGVARRVKEFKIEEVIFSQGSAAGTIMYTQDGGVKITALSASGKEAIIATLGPGTVGRRRSGELEPVQVLAQEGDAEHARDHGLEVHQQGGAERPNLEELSWLM